MATLKKVLLFPVASLLDQSRVRSLTLSRFWLSLSIGTLILSGLFSVVIVFARLPVVSELLFDPLFAKRGLVVHVDLALLIWLYAFLCGMFVLIPSRKKNGNHLQSLGFVLGSAGVSLMVLTMLVPSAEPVLSNYIPVLDHPLFISGLLLFACGVGSTILNSRLLPGAESNRSIFPASAIPGFRAAALLILVAFITFAGSWMGTPNFFETSAYYEKVIWGGGHLLQFVNVAAMLSVWLVLMGKLLNRDAVSYQWSTILFGLYTLPVFAAPLLTMNGTTDTLYHDGFTTYMRWGIFPVVSIFIIICITKLVRAERENHLPEKLWKNPYFGGLITSILLTSIGFILGAMINGSNTMIPAHYHAAVGGITVAFMAITYLLLEVHGISLPEGSINRLASIQPLLFGLGQAVFAAGFAYAGAHGLARKSFAAEQQLHSVEMIIGLGFMAIGGLWAMGGGLLFLWIVFKSWHNNRTQPTNTKRQRYGI